MPSTRTRTRVGAVAAAALAVAAVGGALGLALWQGGGMFNRQGWEAAGWIGGVLAAMIPLVGAIGWAARRVRHAATPDGGSPEPAVSADSDGARETTNRIDGHVSGTVIMAGGGVTVTTPGPRPATNTVEAVPIEAADPARLQVHPAVLPTPDPGGYTFLTPYLPRPHDQEIGERLTPALRGETSVLVMVTGGSSTGKTRALYQALTALAPHRALLCPDTGDDLVHLLERQPIDDQAVLWLNEAQRFFYGPQANEAAAALHRLLARRTGTVAVGTLWTDPYWQDLTRPGTPGDPHTYVRELLTGPVTAHITVPDRLSPDEQRQWQKLAATHGDQRLGQALDAGSADRGRIIQHLSGGPELLRAYLDGPGHHFTATEHALITAAVDARRLGHRAPLPAPLLAQAADGELDPRERPTDNRWGCAALEGLCTGERPGGGRTDIRRALTAVHTHVPRTGAKAAYEPADYLEQQLRRRRADQMGSPALWRALLEHTTDAHSLYTLAGAAQRRGLLQHAVRLYQQAIRARYPTAAPDLARLLSQETDPHQSGTRWIAEHADPTDLRAVADLLEVLHQAGQEKALGVLASRTAEHANPAHPQVVARLLEVLHRVGQEKALGVLASRATEHTNRTDPRAVADLLEVLHRAGQEKALGVLASRATEHTNPTRTGSVARLLEVLHRAGQEKALGVLASRTAEHTNPTDTPAVARLLEVLHQAGQEKAVQVLAPRTAEHTDPTDTQAVAELLEALHQAGQEKALGVLASRATEHTNPTDTPAVADLLEVLHQAGQEKALGVLASRATEHTNPTDTQAVAELLEALHQAGQEETVQVLASRATEHTNPTDTPAVARLLKVLHRAGQEKAVQVLEHRALNAGGLPSFPLPLRHYGRDLDGTPAQAWIWDELVT
ncbi:glycine cleavage system regulatory protein [Nocardiopsis arvandica]|uniref:Glycine cleavage system regulatory protein n=1 Tax=Nocardiopsis sinuspersici TaxID=501010 RepID=A0A7Y9X918_9ACTN|nr:hypothetical protein [Nocardiopsis sinuspersici]NYH51384.1 glycine cleavage system regulatory protein [Nocardiopsis sinuspersici]